MKTRKISVPSPIYDIPEELDVMEKQFNEILSCLMWELSHTIGGDTTNDRVSDHLKSMWEIEQKFSRSLFNARQHMKYIL